MNVFRATRPGSLSDLFIGDDAISGAPFSLTTSDGTSRDFEYADRLNQIATKRLMSVIFAEIAFVIPLHCNAIPI